MSEISLREASENRKIFYHTWPIKEIYHIEVKMYLNKENNVSYFVIYQISQISEIIYKISPPRKKWNVQL